MFHPLQTITQSLSTPRGSDNVHDDVAVVTLNKQLVFVLRSDDVKRRVQVWEQFYNQSDTFTHPLFEKREPI